MVVALASRHDTSSSITATDGPTALDAPVEFPLLLDAPVEFPLLLDALVGMPGLLLVVFVAFVGVVQAVTLVGATERYVRTDGDRVRDVLEPGLHLTRPFDEAEIVDVRTQVLTLPVADATTADGVDATVTISIEVRVDDHGAAVVEPPPARTAPGEDVAAYQIAVMERASDAGSTHTSDYSWRALVDSPHDLEADLRRDLRPAFHRFGVELESLAVESVESADGEQAVTGDAASSTES